MTLVRQRETLTSQLVKALTERVRSGELKPGDRLPTEQELIEEFKVSRTVVREAISSLKAAGLVATQQGVGAFVLQAESSPPFRLDNANLNLLKDVIAVLELRIGIESDAAALAAQRRTPAHLAAMRGALDRMAAAIDAFSRERDGLLRRGVLFWDQRDLDRAVGEAAGRGFQVAQHAIGNEAIRVALAAIERNEAAPLSCPSAAASLAAYSSLAAGAAAAALAPSSSTTASSRPMAATISPTAAEVPYMGWKPMRSPTSPAQGRVMLSSPRFFKAWVISARS